MPLNHDSRDDWSACRPGEIRRLSGRLRRRRQLQRIGRTAVLTSLLGAVVASGFFIFHDPSADNAHIHGITCRECRQIAREYVSGRLDAEKTEQVEQHLADCPSCRDFVANARANPGSRSPADDATGWNETERPIGARFPHDGLNREIASLQ